MVPISTQSSVQLMTYVLFAADLDRDEVKSYLDDYHAAVIICAVFTSFKLLYSNIFVACGYYKQNALATTAVQVGIALSLGCIGWAADSLPTFYVGAYTLPAIILSIWMAWYIIKRIKPVQDEYFVNVMGGEVTRSPSAATLQ